MPKDYLVSTMGYKIFEILWETILSSANTFSFEMIIIMNLIKFSKL